MNLVPRSPEWYAQRCAKMRQAKQAKVTPKSETPAPSLAAKPEREIQRRPSYKRWGEMEIRQVAQAVARLLIKQGIHFIPDESDRRGSQFLIQAIRSAQEEVLPPERRRIFRQRKGLADKFWYQVKKCLRATSTAPLPPVETNGHAASAPIPPVAPPKASEPAPGQALLAVGDAPTALLISTLVTRLFEHLEKSSAPVKTQELERQLEERRQYDEMMMAELSELRKQVEALTPQLKLPLGTLTPFPKAEEPVKKGPRVAILGCRKDQFDVIANEIGKMGLQLDLRHYDQDARPVPVHADWAITLRWVRHHWDDQLHVPNGQRTFIRGGVGQAVQQLESWFRPLSRKVAAS